MKVFYDSTLHDKEAPLTPVSERVWSAKLTRLLVSVSALGLVAVLFGVLRWSAV